MLVRLAPLEITGENLAKVENLAPDTIEIATVLAKRGRSRAAVLWDELVALLPTDKWPAYETSREAMGSSEVRKMILHCKHPDFDSDILYEMAELVRAAEY